MKEQSSTDKAPSAPKFLSQSITSGGFVFVSGQIHTLPDNTLVDGSTKDKVDQIMNNIKAILEAANTTLDNVVKVVIYVTDMSQMMELNEAYPAYFKEPYPVREAVCVQALPLGATIEVSVTAFKE